MPYSLDPNASDRPEAYVVKALGDVSYDYNYPKNLDLRPVKSDAHTALKRRILHKAQESFRVISQRHKDWKEIDILLRAYVSPEERIDNRTGRDSSTGDRQDSESIPKFVMPVTYATRETLLTYMAGAFLQDPIFQYDGTGPEDEVGAMLMQKVIDLQMKKSAAGLALLTQWGDGFTYGIGAVSPVWEVRKGRRTVREDEGILDRVANIFQVTKTRKKRTRMTTLWEGHKLINIDPYRMLPDPNVAAHDVQSGEFFGWIERTNIMDLLDRERQSGGDIFNVRYLRHLADARSSIQEEYNRDPSGRSRWIDSNHPVDVVWMYIKIIPKDFELGSGEYPEKWLIAVAGDEVVIAAAPVNLNHNLFPVTVCAPDYDGYSSAPASNLMVIKDLQNVVDFLMSSHVQNVRKAINDMLVVDPSIVNIYDVYDPLPGKVIRKRRSAWGHGGLDDGVKQLEVRDVTAGHVGDAFALIDMAKDSMGATQNLQGVVGRKGPRVSAQEARDARSSGLGRLELKARIISMQAMIPLADMLASQTQQLMEEEVYVKATGEWAQKLSQNFNIDPSSSKITANPYDLLVEYDVIARDGTIPGSQDARLWADVFQILSQQPMVAQSFNMVKIFTHLAQQMGAKNIDQFVNTPTPQAQVTPDEEVLRQVERGNLVPLNGSPV